MKTNYSIDEQQDYQHASNSGLITGMLISAAIGACAAILYAPKPGKQTRQQIREMADKQSQNMKQQWDITQTKAMDALSSAKEKLGSAGKKAQGKLNDFAGQAEDKADQLADQAKPELAQF